MALAHVTKQHWRAVERDVLAMHYRVGDLSTSELASVVLAAPPTSSVRHAIDEGWARSDHLLANIIEQHAGLIRPVHRLPRPGVVAEPSDDDDGPVDPTRIRQLYAAGGNIHTAMPVTELRRKLDAHYAKGRAS